MSFLVRMENQIFRYCLVNLKDFSMKYLLMIITKHTIFKSDRSWDLLSVSYSQTDFIYQLRIVL